MGYLYGIMAELRPSPDGAMVVLVCLSTNSNQHHGHADMHMQHKPLRSAFQDLQPIQISSQDTRQVTQAEALKVHTQHHLRKNSLSLAKAVSK